MARRLKCCVPKCSVTPTAATYWSCPRTAREWQAQWYLTTTATQAVINAAQTQEKAVVDNHSLPASEKLLLLAHFDNVINQNTVRLNQLEADQISSADVITLADQIERARVLEPAKVHRAAPPSRRTSVLIGAFVGLLIGVVVALLWEPVATRLRSSRDTA